MPNSRIATTSDVTRPTSAATCACSLRNASEPSSATTGSAAHSVDSHGCPSGSYDLAPHGAQYRLQRMHREDLLPALGRLIPADRLLTRPGALAPYETDGLTAYRARPRAVVLAESADEVIETVRLCHAARVPFMARGSGTSLSGGAVPIEDGIVIALNRMNRVAAVRSRRAPRGGRARRRQSRRHRAGRAARPLLRAGSLQPVGVHDRRQRRLQLRRRALLPARHDRQPRARPARRARRRHGRDARRRQPRTGGAGSRRACSSDRKGCSASRSRSRCGWWRDRRSIAPCWPPTTACRRPATPCRASSRPGCCPGAMEIMDRLAMDAAEAAVARRLPDRARPPCCIVELRGRRRAGGRGVRAADGDHRGLRARRTRTSPPTTRNGRGSGRAASARSRPSAGSARTSSSRTASCRARGSARRWRRSKRCRAHTASVSPTCSTPATATCIR